MDKNKLENGILAQHFRAQFPEAFRGEIYDYASQIDLQSSGYSVKGKFDINSALHLKEPFEAIRNPSVRMVSVLGAVQTLKTLLSELVLPYWIEHDPGEALMLIDKDEKAQQMATTRQIPLLKSIPNIAQMLEEMDRHDATKTEINFPQMGITWCGLNESNAQSRSFRYVVADEVWRARANGLIRQAIARTRQYPDTSKVILLGQGGWSGEDADTLHKETDMRELHFACPSCGELQPFAMSRLRDDTFPVESLRGTFSGLTWDKSDKTMSNGRWLYEEVGKTTHIRCHFCDHRIEDTPEVRRELMRTYKYIPTNPRAPHYNVGFHWPALASTRIHFKYVAIEYLQAKTAKEEQAYLLPMQEFYQKWLAIHWSEDLASESRAVTPEDYDASADWPEEKFRVLIADCQKDLQKFFYHVYSIAESGECRMRARGVAGSFDELAAIQQEHKVQDQRVFLDCGYEMSTVLRECQKRGHWQHVKVGGRVKRVYRCWTGLKGSGSESFAHVQKLSRDRSVREWRVYSPKKWFDVNQGKSGPKLRAPWYEWSNLQCKNLLRARRDGMPGVPKFLVLPDPLPEDDHWSYFMQMRSETIKTEFANGRKRSIWEPINKTRPNHDWDIGAMLVAFLAIKGIVGREVEAQAETADETKA